jgi:hypothetical protein
MELTFDEYWDNLIRKIYVPRTGKENQNALKELSTNDLIFYRLGCIRGETTVDGVQAYFERRFNEFESDMKLLTENGFQDLAEKYYRVKMIMFGENILTEEFIDEYFEEYYSSDNDEMEKEIDDVSMEIIKIIEERFDNYRIEFGIKNGLFRGE